MDKFQSDLKKLLVASGGIAVLCICFFAYTFVTAPKTIPLSNQQGNTSTQEQTTLSPLGSTLADTQPATPAEAPVSDNGMSVNSSSDATQRSTTATTSFSDGTQLVGVDIEPGKYESTNPASDCQYEKLTGDKSSKGKISTLATGILQKKITISIDSSDNALITSGCGTWKKVE